MVSIGNLTIGHLQNIFNLYPGGREWPIQSVSQLQIAAFKAQEMRLSESLVSKRLQRHLFGLRVLLCLTRFSVPLRLKPRNRPRWLAYRPPLSSFYRTLRTQSRLSSPYSPL
jgi:hypothetical protein